jgi:hypothetical protein
MPSNVITTLNKQYVSSIFDNGWEISMRLHTASSQLKNSPSLKSPSLKFDTKALNNLLPATIIPYA